jgi:hypothetical protein
VEGFHAYSSDVAPALSCISRACIPLVVYLTLDPLQGDTGTPQVQLRGVLIWCSGIERVEGVVGS